MTEVHRHVRAAAARMATWSRTSSFIVVVSAVATTVFLRDLLSNLSDLGAFGDIRYFHFLWEVARTSWTTYGQLPLWNPYYCGGMVDLANAQSMALFPTNLLSILTDAGTGMRLHIVLHVGIAFAGMAFWARQRGIGSPWCFGPALAFAMSGFFSERATGHVSFMAFAWIPWILICWDAARRRARWAWVAGGIVAVCVYDGSPYATAFSVLLIAALAVSDAIAQVSDTRRVSAALRPLGLGALAGLAFATVGAFKLFPVLEFLTAHPRAIPEADDTLSLWQLWEIFMRREIRRGAEGYTYVFGEYRDYVGPFVLGGALLALLGRRAKKREIALVLVFVLLTLGHHGPLSPYALLHDLPVFGSLRVPARFAILILPFVALWFGEGLRWLASRTRGRRLWSVVAAAILALASVDLYSVNADMLARFFNTPIPSIEPAPSFHHIRGRGGEQWRAPLENRGVIACYEPNPIDIARTLRSGPVEQLSVLPKSAGTARLEHFSPNELELATTLNVSATVIVNQNFDVGWRTSVGEVIDEGGRIGIVLPPGSHRFTVAYVPRGLSVFLGLTLVGLLGIALVVTADTRATRMMTRMLRRMWSHVTGAGGVHLVRREVVALVGGFLTVGLLIATLGATLSAGAQLTARTPVALLAGIRDDLVVLIAGVGLTLLALRLTAPAAPARRWVGWALLTAAWLVGAYAVVNLYFVRLYGAPLSVAYLVYGTALREAPALIDLPALLTAGGGLALYGLVTLLLVTRWRARVVAWTRRRRTWAAIAVLGAISVLVPRDAATVLGIDRNALSALWVSHDASSSTAAPDADAIRHTWSTWPVPNDEVPAAVEIRRSDPPRHLVLWLAEGVGTRYLELFGAEEETAPNLTALSRHSLRFDRYYTNVPISIKAIFNVLCGAYPYPDSNFITELSPRIACPSLMEELTRAGWDAALLHGGFFAFTNKLKFLGRRGFDLMLDAASVPDREQYFTNGWGIDDGALVDHALAWLDGRPQPEAPSLAVFIPITPHFPYFLPPDAPRPFSEREEIGRYRNGIRYTDALFGRVVEAYRERGLAEDTLFVFVGDHGQAFHQHPRNRLHGSFIYEENVHTPLVLINERLFPTDELSHRLGSHVDLLPTLLDLLGRPRPASLPGQSLVAEDFEYRPVMFSTHYQDRLLGLRDGPYKLIFNLRTGRSELYDLTVDPLEQSDIAKAHRPRIARYERYLRELTAWQRHVIETTPTLGASYLELVVGALSATIVDERGEKPCDVPRDGGGVTCPGEADWMWAGPATLRVFNIERECLRVHPPREGTLRLRFNRLAPLPRVIGAGLTDAGIRAHGAPVTVTWRIGDASPIVQTVSDRRGFVEQALDTVAASGPLEIDIRAERWDNRTICLSLSP